MSDRLPPLPDDVELAELLRESWAYTNAHQHEEPMTTEYKLIQHWRQWAQSRLTNGAQS